MITELKHENGLCSECGISCDIRYTMCRSCSKIGSRNPFYGKKHNQDIMKVAGAKSGASRLGKKQIKRWSQEARDRHSKRLAGQRHSPKTEFKKGDISPNYKGGITPLNRWIRTTDKNKTWIKSVLERDDFTCQDCGVRGVKLEAHHINRFSNILKNFLAYYSQFSPIEDKEILVRLSDSYNPFFDVNNGKTLCVSCHSKTKGRATC